MRPHIEIVIEERKWSAHRGLSRRLEQAARLALWRGGCRRRGADVSILLADDSRLKALNARFRGKNRPTNVLAFETVSGGASHLGDIAVAYGLSAREARAQGKTLARHAAHLVVHGVLHLLGFDHQTVREAAKMEPLETAILAELGIPDPYTTRAKTA
jgi:probable rRNA maturation factor